MASNTASVLQHCFECTEWQVFKEATTNSGEVDLEEYTSSLTCYISKCVDDITTTITITIYTDQKPWLTAEVRSLLRARDSAFRSRDTEMLRVAEKKKLEYISTNDPRSMWAGIKSITDYKRRDAECPRDLFLPYALNAFYARFEDSNTTTCTRLTIPLGEKPPIVTTEDVNRDLQRHRPRYNSRQGPERLCTSALRGTD